MRTGDLLGTLSAMGGAGREDGSVDVRLRDVTKRFGDVVAVDSVSVEVRRGEFFSLLGPSGCGKTTTLRIISRSGSGALTVAPSRT